MLGEGCAELSFVSIRLAIERKLRFLEESGDWLLFWPWYCGTGGEKRGSSFGLFWSRCPSGLLWHGGLSLGSLLGYVNGCSGIECDGGCSYAPLSIEHVGTIGTTCEERGARSCCTAGKRKRKNI